MGVSFLAISHLFYYYFLFLLARKKMCRASFLREALASRLLFFVTVGRGAPSPSYFFSGDNVS